MVYSGKNLGLKQWFVLYVHCQNLCCSALDQFHPCTVHDEPKTSGIGGPLLFCSFSSVIPPTFSGTKRLPFLDSWMKSWGFIFPTLSHTSLYQVGLRGEIARKKGKKNNDNFSLSCSEYISFISQFLQSKIRFFSQSFECMKTVPGTRVLSESEFVSGKCQESKNRKKNLWIFFTLSVTQAPTSLPCPLSRKKRFSWRFFCMFELAMQVCDSGFQYLSQEIEEGKGNSRKLTIILIISQVLVSLLISHAINNLSESQEVPFCIFSRIFTYNLWERQWTLLV